MDKLVIKSNVKAEQVLRKPLMVDAKIFDRIQEISNETRYRKGPLGDMLLEFALERLVIDESPTEEE